ncbi:carboxypeptidase regulatory-like domain-containing protein [Mucilaginibacter gynuensis]|uniref:Carboxypeptidase regulatory-like domain-containing protein n=2 Tax=Mucilaginibacter gynuensis TaxID=1302236 RepID=A0ABP8FTB5_9SPHI
MPGLLFAQATKSSIAGIIYDENKIPVEGASIKLIYQPGNTQYGCASNKTGRFYLPDVKPGGPYELTITGTGYSPYVKKELYLYLDDPVTLSIVLGGAKNTLSEVLIKAPPGKYSRLSTGQTGPEFKAGRTELSTLPAIKRSINEFVRLMPQAFGPAVAGGNYRQNFITIDGSEFNNNFGVGENLPGNGAQPISLDAIDQLSVNVAPYNTIWESGFIGSTINILTRSGSNRTEASVYTFFRNQNSYGYKAGNDRFEKRDINYNQFGFRLGGPLVKNKLFYFISAEFEREVYDPQQLVAASAGVPYGSNSNIARPSETDLNTIRDYLQNTYHYDAGPYNDYNFENRSMRLLARFDWNIAPNNTFSIRYNQLNSSRPELVNGSRSPLTAYPAGLGRRNMNALTFSNANFSTLSNFYSLAAEWNVKLKSTLAATVRASYTRQYEPRESESAIFPFVDILKDGTPYTSFGYEPFTYANSRDVNLTSLTSYLNWNYYKNNWLFGLQTDYSRTKNSYMPFGTGYYTFASWDDFVNGARPVDYAMTYSIVPGKQQPSYSFNYMNLALFAQDNIIVNKNLNITAGLRLDLPFFPEPLAENQAIANLTFAGGQRLHTSQLPKASVLFSPRVGFRLQLNDSWRLRGGSGIFTGRIPFVWIISQARYSGVFQVTQTWQGQGNTPGSFNPDPQAYAPKDLPAAGATIPSVTSVLSRDFKMPQTWKTSLALDVKLPAGITGTIDALYNKDIYAIVFKDVNLNNPQRLNIEGYPDKRLVYPAANSKKFINPLNGLNMPDAAGNSPFNAVLVSNSSQGYYWSLTGQLEKKFAGLTVSAAYIRSMAKNYNDGDGDQTLSALNATPSVNGINQLALGYAGYVSPQRVVASFMYNKPYLKKFKLGIGLVYQGAIDGRFSYTYAQDFTHDGTNKSLIYIPKDASEITFVPIVSGKTRSVLYTAQQQSDAFFKYVAQDDYLRKHKGAYAERNGAVLPWRNQVDLRLTHDFYFYHKSSRHTLQLTWDVFNFGNLLNANWGLKKQVNAGAILIPANLPQVQPNGNIKPVFQLATVGSELVNKTFRNDVSTNSTYAMQFGVRYLFQ